MRRKRSRKSPVPKIIAVILIIAILAGGGVVFGPRLIHHCSNCDKLFFGTGYYANIVTDTITDLTGKEEKTLCKDCAAEEHAISVALGHSLDEYKRPLFESSSEDES